MTDDTPTEALDRVNPGLEDRVVQTQVISDVEIKRIGRVARAFAMSGMFKDAQQEAQAFTKIMFGRELGLSAAEAMAALHLVDGKVEVSADLQASRVNSTPGYEYRVRRIDGEACVIDFYRHGDHVGRSEFTFEDAEQAGLPKRARGKNAGGGTYDRYPRNMLFARAMSNGVAWFVPEVMHGLRVYVDGEVDVTGPDPRATAEPAKLPDDLPSRTEVEAVIAEAREKGHAGLSDVATVAMTLGDQPPEFVAGWLERSWATLHGMPEQEPEPAEAEVVPEDDWTEHDTDEAVARVEADSEPDPLWPSDGENGGK